MRFQKALPIFLILIFLITAFNVDSQVIYDDRELELNEPSLAIKKWTEVTHRIEPLTNVTVYVNITNMGDVPAHNLDIVEPVFENWTILELVNFEERNWLRIDPGATYSYEYTFQFTREGNFVIESTQIDYFGVNESTYHSKSGAIFMEVFYEAEPASFDEQWNDMFWLSSLFIAIPIVLYVVQRFVLKV